MTQCTDFSIIGVPIITVTNITTDTPTVTYGTTTVKFTATVTNSGTASGTANVQFYLDVIPTPTLVGLPILTGTISVPNGTGTVDITVGIAAFPVGTYRMCAKTNYE